MVAPKFLSLASTVLAVAQAQTYSATYLPSNAPKTTEEGQTGTNQCGTGSSQTSMCQNAYLNSVDDWYCHLCSQPQTDLLTVLCLGSSGFRVCLNTERIEVAWCIKDGYGTRLIPDGAITGAHFVQTPDFVQITGVGDLTKINVPAGDGGGELDPHGADGNGKTIGGLVFSSAFGQLEQIFEWTNFLSDSQFCFRACKPGSSMAPTWCQHIYDEMGCNWNMPANYDAGVFEQCQGDSGEPMGVYGSSTFHQGDPATPAAHPIPSSSQCNTISTIGNKVPLSSQSASASTSASTTGSANMASTTASVSGSARPTSSASRNVAGTSSAGSAAASSSGPASTSGTAAGSTSSNGCHQLVAHLALLSE